MTLRASFPMMLNQVPIVMTGGLSQQDWYIFLVNLYRSATEGLPQPEEAVTLEASPMVYLAVIRGQAHVGGGTVSAVEFSRNGSDWYDAGITEGFVQMDKGDFLRVTYSIAPTITYFPM